MKIEFEDEDFEKTQNEKKKLEKRLKKEQEELKKIRQKEEKIQKKIKEQQQKEQEEEKKREIKENKIKKKKELKEKKQQEKEILKENNKINLQDEDAEEIEEDKKHFFSFKLLFLILLIIIIGLVIYAIKSPNFIISEIQASRMGNGENVTKQEVIKKADSLIGQNIFLLDFDKVNNELSQIPFIKTTKINRIFPNTIEILYSERIPYVLINSGDTNFMLDNKGKILKISNEENSENLLIVYGISLDNLKEGDFLSGKESTKFRNIVYFIENITHINFKYDVVSIDYGESDKLKFKIANQDLEIIYGEINKDTISDKMLYIQEIIKEIGDIKGTLDISAENYSEKVILSKNLE